MNDRENPETIKWIKLNKEMTTLSYNLVIRHFHFVINRFIHLVRTQNLPKSQYFLPPATHTCVYISESKTVSFPRNFAYVLNGWSEAVNKEYLRLLKFEKSS